MALIRWKPENEISSWSPLRDLVNMQRELGRVFDGIFSDFDGNVPSMTRWAPHVDISEDKDSYTIKAELPGVSKNDVKITLQDNLLTLKGEKKQENEEKGSSYHRVERSYGSFERAFTLPTSVKSEKIDASFKDGVLTITLPKAEDAKPREIEVKLS